MRKLIALSAALIGVFLVLVAPAEAVKFGQPDGNGHPYVGLAV
ncbi:MAG: serine protease, partial [Actinobacteria bacterium]